VLTSGGVGVDGLKVPQEGRGAGSFINDCFHVVGKPRPGGGLFAYNVRCERRLGRFVFIGLLPIAKGDEFFFKYKNRPVAMGWVKYKWVPRQLGPYSTKTEVTCITEGMCPGCRKWAPTRDLEEGLERWWHTECLQRAPPMPPPAGKELPMAKAGSQVDPASFTVKPHRRSSTGGVNLEDRNPILSRAPPLPLPLACKKGLQGLLVSLVFGWSAKVALVMVRPIPTPPQPHSNPTPTPSQPHPNPNPNPNPNPTPTLTHPNPTPPQPNPTPTPPHPNPNPTPHQPHPHPNPYPNTNPNPTTAHHNHHHPKPGRMRFSLSPLFPHSTFIAWGRESTHWIGS
jgi:hypothetical protein